MRKINFFLISRIINYIKKEILFINVRNSNIRDLAFKDYCYKKMNRKYRKIIDEFKNDGLKIHSKYVWICWFQGEERAPLLVKSCIQSAKKKFLDKEVIVLNDENLYQYVEFPDYIRKKRDCGLINDALFSDLIRLQLLNKYGGLWIDATVYVSNMCSMNFWEKDLFVFKEMSLFKKEELPIRASNWLIYATTNNNILVLTEKLLYEYYKKELTIKNYYIFHLFFSMASKKFEEEWKKIEVHPNVNNHLLQFELQDKYNEKRWKNLMESIEFHKLNRRIIIDDEESNYYHLVEDIG